MHVYDIYEHPRSGRRAVKQGFSWWAFVAPSVWAATLGLGKVTLALVLASTLLFDILDLVAQFVRHPVAMGATFIIAYALFGLRPGMRGYLWVGSHLREEGWERRCRVVARSRGSALRSVSSGSATFDPQLLSALS